MASGGVQLNAGLTVAAAGVTYGAARLTPGRILRPIAELTATAERVTQTRDLTARLRSTGPNDDGTNDEVGRLTSAFDTMMAALHESVTAQRQLVADAAPPERRGIPGRPAGIGASQ